MNITNAQYYRILVDKDTYENTGVKATIDGQEMSVPLDPANRHYAAILEWAEEDGNTIQEAD
tara:strand:+ start:544 stop:729 length:186 start_codon:yes stop_codon:yes gene_type:complete